MGTSQCSYSLQSSLKAGFYNSEQVALQESVKKLVDEVINPNWQQWKQEGSFPAKTVFKKFGEAGLLGIHRSTQYGGQGLSYKYHVAMLEAMGHSQSPGATMAIGVQTDCSTPALANYGSDHLKRTYLAPAIAGDMVTSIAVSEPGGGSDVGSIATTAVRSGDDLVINGSKMWITSGMQSDWACLLANTEKEGGKYLNKSLIILPMDSQGITKSPINKMGMRDSDTAILTFDNVHVPYENIIGEPGMGFVYQMKQFQEERLAAAIGSLIPLSLVLEETIEYTQQRSAFGKPLISNQYLAFRLAELFTGLEMLRAATYQAVDQMEAGQDVTLLASMLKLKVGRLYRDLRLWSIGGGADEVMLGIICKLSNILPSKK